MNPADIRFPREYDFEEDNDQSLAESSKYPVNLFSAYGVNCNRPDHIAAWKIRAAAGLPESAAQLGLAYLDGNGVVADLASARRWLTVAAEQGHAFARYKLAAIDFEACRSGARALDEDGVALFNALHACARQGVGEACVSLHFILKDHAALLRMLGADTSAAQSLTQVFMDTLSLCYRHREGDSPDKIIAGLRRLADLGSGRACQLAAQLLTKDGRKEEALEYYLLGAKHCRHPACLHQALKLSSDRKPLLAWAKENLPTARVRFRLTMEAFQGMFETGRGADAEVTRSIRETFSAYVQEERFIEGRSFLEFLFDLRLWGSSAEHQRLMSEFALRLRNLCPSLIATDFCHARLEQAFQELRQAVDARCAEKGQPALTKSTEAIGSLIGKPDEYLAMTPEQLTRNEFCQIEEYGQLIKGVMGGSGHSCRILSIWTWNQMFGTKRTHYKGLSAPNRLIILSYGFARMSEILSGERAPMRDMLEANINERMRENIDQHCEKDMLRHSSDPSGFYLNFGRGYRQSFRFLADLHACRTEQSTDFRPWSVVPPKQAKADPVARLNDAPLLSACPIGKDWLLPNPDFRAFPNDHVALSELIVAGDYDGARHRYCTAMYAELMNLGKGLRVEVVHPLAHETLSLMAREMIFKGDHAAAEPIVDYLLYAQLSLKPRGRLWHLSAWLKYRQGRLDDALYALEDTLSDFPQDTLTHPDVDADIFELRLFYVELLLRDQRFAHARAAYQKLVALCEQVGRSEPRLGALGAQIKSLTEETALQYAETAADGKSTLSRSHFDRDLEIKPTTMMGRHMDMAMLLEKGVEFGDSVAEFRRLPLSNMDRYRCLFPANNSNYAEDTHMSASYRPPDHAWEKAVDDYNEVIYDQDPQFLKKMAENEDPPALFSKVPGFEDSVARYRFYYGVMLYEGKKIPRDYAEAVKWLSLSAAQGNDEAMHALGICHIMGHGTEQDASKAAHWFRQAAERGNRDAQNNLGNCYSNGDGVPLDLEQAAHWWRMAAMQHVPQAQFNLGCMALQLSDDQVEAYFWWRIVGSKHPKAAESLSKLIELMPPETLREAERRYAAAFSSHHGP